MGPAKISFSLVIMVFMQMMIPVVSLQCPLGGKNSFVQQ